MARTAFRTAFVRNIVRNLRERLMNAVVLIQNHGNWLFLPEWILSPSSCEFFRALRHRKSTCSNKLRPFFIVLTKSTTVFHRF